MRDVAASWQKILAQGFASSSELLSFLNLPELHGCPEAEKSFKMRVPRSFAARMRQGDAADPLLLQVLASQSELPNVENYSEDPLLELAAAKTPGLLHKYHGRVLLTLTGACAVHCRYCFRRHFPYEENNPGRQGLNNTLDYIRNDRSIHEVILSGGDPLLVTDRMLLPFAEKLAAIPHVRTLRFHSRVPVVLPERIDDNFLSVLESISLQKVMVIHCNHPNEMSEDVKQACIKLRQVGCTMLNQSVLLKSVNDSVNVLAELSTKLFDAGVLPYYLHVLDKVKGAAHFDLSEQAVTDIFNALQVLLPGYLVPRLVREEAGEKHKTLLKN